LEVKSEHEKIGLAKVKETQEFMETLLDSMGSKRKVVVFAHHRSVMSELYTWAVSHLRQKGQQGIILDGETEARDRHEQVPHDLLTKLLSYDIVNPGVLTTSKA